MWRERQVDVRVAGVAALDQGTLVPRAAFHPKFYVFDRPDGTVAKLGDVRKSDEPRAHHQQ